MNLDKIESRNRISLAAIRGDRSGRELGLLGASTNNTFIGGCCFIFAFSLIALVVRSCLINMRAVLRHDQLADLEIVLHSYIAGWIFTT